MTLLRKDHFLWTPASQLAFDRLKSLMTEAPILATPDFIAPFIMETNALGIAMGVVLMQNSHPLLISSSCSAPDSNKLRCMFASSMQLLRLFENEDTTSWVTPSPSPRITGV